MSWHHLPHLQHLVLSLRHFAAYHHSQISAAVLAAIGSSPPQRPIDYFNVVRRLAALSACELVALKATVMKALPRHYGQMTREELRDELSRLEGLPLESEDSDANRKL